MNKLATVKGYGNILVRIENIVSKTCIYCRVLTGNLRGGMINCGYWELSVIPGSEETKVF